MLHLCWGGELHSDRWSTYSRHGTVLSALHNFVFCHCPQYDQHKYAVAQVETMQQTVASIKYTPTFGIYRNGKRVDEVVGKDPQKLEDHLWLHSD